MAKRKISEWNLFKCLTCEDKPEFDSGEQVKVHLETVHGIKEAKGTRTLALHLDGNDWYQSDYNWSIGDVQLEQQVRCKRTKADKSYWSR